MVSDKNHVNSKALAQLPHMPAEPLYGSWEHVVRGYKQFCAMAAAVRLRIFDHLVELRQPVDLAVQINADPKMTKDLCDLLADMGLLVRYEDGFLVSALSRTYLCSDSAWFQEEVIKNIFSGFGLWQQLDQICIQGPIQVDESDFFENNLVDSLAAEILTGELQQTVAAIVRQPEFASAHSMLDLGGGHGLYAMALTRQKKDLEAAVFDFNPVEKDFNRYKEKFNANGVRFIAGNLFADDIGNGFDLVLFSYNPGGKNERILKKIHQCLNPGGLFVTKHALYKESEEEKSTLLDIEWQLTAFRGVEKGGNVYAFENDLFEEAYMERLRQDFEIVEIIDAKDFATPPLAKFGDRLDSKIIISRKR
jgi:SAM-dependent methyltransferase